MRCCLWLEQLQDLPRGRVLRREHLEQLLDLAAVSILVSDLPLHQGVELGLPVVGRAELPRALYLRVPSSLGDLHGQPRARGDQVPVELALLHRHPVHLQQLQRVSGLLWG